MPTKNKYQEPSDEVAQGSYPGPWDKVTATILKEKPERNKTRIGILKEEDKALQSQGIQDKSLQADIKLQEADLMWGFPKETGLDVDTKHLNSDSIAPDDITKSKLAEKLNAEFGHKKFTPPNNPVGDGITTWVKGMKERVTHPLDFLNNLVKESSFYKQQEENKARLRRGEKPKLSVTDEDLTSAIDFIGGAGITKNVFKNIFSQEALDKAVKLSNSSKTHTLVMMPTKSFLDLAYPLSKTQEDLAKAMKVVPSKKELQDNLLERMRKVKSYAEKDGVNDVPHLRFSGQKIDMHDGRTRAMYALSQGQEHIPVMLEDSTGMLAKGSPYKYFIDEAEEKLIPTEGLYSQIKE